MKNCIITVFFLSMFAVLAHAEVVIIGNKGLEFNSLTKEEVKKIYLGRIFTINGIKIKPSDCRSIQKKFLSKYIGKSVKTYNKTWLKKIFAEGLTAPVIFKTPDEVMNFVKNTEGAIGYISGTTTVNKILLE